MTDPAPTAKFSALFVLPVDEDTAPEEVALPALTAPLDVALESAPVAVAEAEVADTGRETAEVVVWPYTEAFWQFKFLVDCAALWPGSLGHCK